MRPIGWLLAAALFLSPAIVTGLFVWHWHDGDQILSLAEEEELEYDQE